MYRRRRDIGKGTPALGLRDKPNARTSTSWPMLSLRVRRSQERTNSVTRRIHKRRRRRDNHTPELDLGPIVMKANNAHFNVVPHL